MLISIDFDIIILIIITYGIHIIFLVKMLSIIKKPFKLYVFIQEFIKGVATIFSTAGYKHVFSNFIYIFSFQIIGVEDIPTELASLTNSE